jgi:hypothetical protein
MNSVDQVRRAGQAGYIAAAAGLVALVTISLFLTVGQPFGTINDLSLLVMTLAIGPLMVGFYELGGRAPLAAARFSLAVGIAAVLAWSVIQAAMIAGLVTFDYDHAATGGFAAEAIALVLIGAWLVGANGLAGDWLGTLPRWLGVVGGLGFIVFAAGLLLGGINHQLTYLGGIGYQVLFPVWAYLLGRALSRRSVATSGSPT